MIVGNVGALGQKNIKRMLGYSSIANGGYLMMAFVTYNSPLLKGETVSSMLFYLFAYMLTSFAAWAVITALEHDEAKGLELQDYAGLGRSKPLLAVVMLIAMLSFTGVTAYDGLLGEVLSLSHGCPSWIRASGGPGYPHFGCPQHFIICAWL